MNVLRIVYTQEIVASPDNQMVEAEPQVFFQISRMGGKASDLPRKHTRIVKQS